MNSGPREGGPPKFLAFPTMEEATTHNSSSLPPSLPLLSLASCEVIALMANLAVTNQSKASAAASVSTLLNSAVGAGVLSLPYAYRCAGWAGGLVITFVVAAVEAFTLFVLARYAEHTGTSTYSSLVRTMLGRKASALMSLVLLVYGYGSAVAYMIILGDSFQPMLSEAFGDMWWTARQPIIAAGTTMFMLPLCFPTSLAAISGVSAMTFYALLVVVGTIMYRSVQILRSEAYCWGDLQPFNLTTEWLGALPIIVFGFQCHTNVVAVWSELQDEPGPVFPSSPSLSSLLAGTGGGGEGATLTEQSGYEQLPPQAEPPPRKPKSIKLIGMTQVVTAAIGITAVFYSLVGMFGYMAFPTSAKSNILNSFGARDHVIQVARAVIGLIQIAHYPVNHNPARSAARDLLSLLTGKRLLGRKFNIIETLIFFSITLGMALLVDDLGVVFQLVGGVCGAFFIFGAPGSLLMQYAYAKHVVAKGTAGNRLLERAALGINGRNDDAIMNLQGHYHYLKSKLFWAGVMVLVLGIMLCCITVYTIINP